MAKKETPGPMALLQKQLNNKIVIKANALIQQSGYKLSINEFRVLSIALSKINPEQTALAPVTISFSEVFSLINARDPGKSDYDHIKDISASLKDKGWWMQFDPNSDEITRVSWAEEVSISEGSKKINFTFNKSLSPYLIQVPEENSTQYRLSDAISFKHNMYGPRLLDLFKTHLHEKIWYVSIEDLRYNLGLIDKDEITGETKERYLNVKELRRCVLDPAIKEINSVSAFHVIANYSTNGGRKYTSVLFEIMTQEQYKDLKKQDAVEKANIFSKEQLVKNEKSESQ